MSKRETKKENKQTYTPGPWFAALTRDLRYQVVARGQNEPICALGDTDADNANTLAIAALPDLIEALRLAIAPGNPHADRCPGRPCNCYRSLGAAAIARAEGE